jgi:hypothetical protein
MFKLLNANFDVSKFAVTHKCGCLFGTDGYGGIWLDREHLPVQCLLGDIYPYIIFDKGQLKNLLDSITWMQFRVVYTPPRYS